MLIDGKWDTDWHPVQKADKDGRFLRQTSTFRHWITPDGSDGPEGQPAYAAEPGRFHLIVAYICPWASRTLIVRAMKGLEDVVPLTVVHPELGDQGWRFGVFPGSTAKDSLIGATFLHEFYSKSDPHVSGRATVPVLWDSRDQRIVNNESADIIRILNSGFGDLATGDVDVRPEALLPEIEALNARLYDRFNNGVYRAGFATSQLAHDEAVSDVFETLDWLEDRLSGTWPFLLGETLTEPDIRAFVTLIRFDAAYVGLFKTNRKRIADYPHLQAYLKRMLEIDEVRRTVRIDHIKAGYYSIKALNPSGIVPNGPDLSALGL